MATRDRIMKMKPHHEKAVVTVIKGLQGRSSFKANSQVQIGKFSGSDLDRGVNDPITGQAINRFFYKPLTQNIFRKCYMSSLGHRLYHVLKQHLLKCPTDPSIKWGSYVRKMFPL